MKHDDDMGVLEMLARVVWGFVMMNVIAVCWGAPIFAAFAFLMLLLGNFRM